MTRQQARRYVDIRFLRRSTPTDDFSMRLDPDTGWWTRWKPSEDAADARRTHLEPSDIVAACQAAGGSWPSTKQAALALGHANDTALKLLETAERAGAIERFVGPRRATGWRLPRPQIPTPANHPHTP
jgi:hypothetical protein